MCTRGRDRGHLSVCTRGGCGGHLSVFKARVTTKTTMKQTASAQLHSVRFTSVSLKLKARIATATISPSFSLTGIMFQILPKVKNKRKGWNKKVFLQELEESL